LVLNIFSFAKDMKSNNDEGWSEKSYLGDFKMIKEKYSKSLFFIFNIYFFYLICFFFVEGAGFAYNNESNERENFLCVRSDGIEDGEIVKELSNG
jgi:hypothetical protein